MANPRGMPTLPSALIRPTAQPEPPVEREAEPAEVSELVEGRGAPTAHAPTARTRRRMKTAAVSEKTTKRGVYLTDAVWERLQLEAIRRRTNVSAIAEKVLGANLPKLRIENEV